MLNGNILVGVWKDAWIVRLGPDRDKAALLEPHVREMDVTGRPMKGWVMVAPVARASRSVFPGCCTTPFASSSVSTRSRSRTSHPPTPTAPDRHESG